MARRRNRKGSSNANTNKILIIVVSVLALIIVGSMLLKNIEGDKVKIDHDFSLPSYREDASRLTSTGNKYAIEGKVVLVEEKDNDRLVIVSTKKYPNERLPLFVPAGNSNSVNIKRGDTLVFEIESKNGRAEDGKHVKGVLIVRDVHLQ